MLKFPIDWVLTCINYHSSAISPPQKGTAQRVACLAHIDATIGQASPPTLAVCQTGGVRSWCLGHWCATLFDGCIRVYVVDVDVDVVDVDDVVVVVVQYGHCLMVSLCLVMVV